MPHICQLTELIELRLLRCDKMTNDYMVHLQTLTMLEHLLSAAKQLMAAMLQNLRSPFLIGVDLLGSSTNKDAITQRINELRTW